MDRTTSISHDGVERRKADFLVLEYLNQHGSEATFRELKDGIFEVNNDLEEQNFDSPIHFTPTTGPEDIYSRSLIRSISRCTSKRSVHKDEGTYHLTDAGRRSLEDDYLEQFGVPMDFRESIRKWLSGDRERVQHAGD